VAELLKQDQGIRVFVFSDDPGWVRENLRIAAPMTVLEGNSVDQGYVDLEFMRHCRHHIVANSSFSWWGAWLASAPGQRVIAPARWFADRDTDTTDVVPKSWKRI
jgi:hypothetical protein